MSSSSHDNIDHLAADYGQDFTPDVEAGLNRLHARLGLANGKAGGRVRRMTPRTWLSIAASVIVLISTGLFFLSSDATVLSNNTDQPLAVELPDGSSVLLQTGAKVSYDNNFDETERRVTISGQGFFEVEKDATKPFLVTTGETTLRVTGTAFNLRVVGQEMEVEVSEGSVELSDEASTVRIAAKQCGLVKAGKSPVLMEAPNLNRHAWRTGKLHFENTPLQDVLKTLSNNWGLEIKAPPSCNYPISADYKTIDLQAILEGVAKVGGITCQAEGEKTYRFTGACAN